MEHLNDDVILELFEIPYESEDEFSQMVNMLDEADEDDEEEILNQIALAAERQRASSGFVRDCVPGTSGKPSGSAGDPPVQDTSGKSSGTATDPAVQDSTGTFNARDYVPPPRV